MHKKAWFFGVMFFLIPIVMSNSGLTATKTPVFTRPITIICAHNPGSDIDLITRALAEEMKKTLEVQINVINMPGGFGGIATDYVWNKPHDGYHILGTSESNLMLPVNGGHHTTAKDWAYFIAGGSPGVLMVPAQSKYQTFKDFINDVQSNPEKVKVATGEKGSFSHIKWLILSQIANFKTEILNYSSIQKSSLAALNGEVNAVHCSMGEAYPFLAEQKFRPLAITDNTGVNFEKIGNIPAITNYLPDIRLSLPLPQWSGLAVPADVNKRAMSFIERAFVVAMRKESVLQTLTSQKAVPYGLFKTGWYGRNSRNIVKSLESRLCWSLVELNLAKKTPEELTDIGIEKLR